MRPRPNASLVALAAIAAAAAIVTTRSSAPTPSVPEAVSWSGLIGEAHPQVAIGQRRIVVLRTPSVAQQLVVARYATEEQERTWTAQAYAAQQQVLEELSAHGLGVRPDYSFARVLDGFSAPLDPRAQALLEQDPEVAGIYPVRAAFPASVASGKLTSAIVPAAVELPGFDGRGVQIALLDTGVDRSQPYLGGRVAGGVDIVGANTNADAQPSPQNPSLRERHGTELAGLLVGAGGPRGIHGAAPGATVFPVRIAGWQPDSTGRDVIYARSDQLIAGLDAAVDPNGDGDTHDAARIAVIGVSEPYAAFTDDPEAMAVNGAFDLDTLVVVPAGNEGVAGPTYGSLDGPGGAQSALTVGALDPRDTTVSVHFAVWRGLRVLFNARLALLGSIVPERARDLSVGVPHGAGEQASDYFDAHGLGLVAGKAALVHVGGDPGAAAAAASQAGAAAVLFYGGDLPAGSLGLSSDVDIPVIAIPQAAASAIIAGKHTGVALGRARTQSNPLAGHIASFSSRGLSFSGAIKPDLSAPGIGLATSDPDISPDGEPSFATVNGTSAAAAGVAGAAAVLAQARPELSASELASLLAGSARQDAAPLPAGGAGAIDLGASAAGELTASLTSLSFARGKTIKLVLRDVSARRLVVTAHATAGLTIVPSRIELRPGRTAHLRVSTTAVAGSFGVLDLQPAGGQSLRLPWLVPSAPPSGSLIRSAELDSTMFTPSDVTPAVLTVEAGRVDTRKGVQIEPVSELDVLLYSSAGVFEGVLARERDLLPGRYSFGITGRSSGGALLAPGDYEIRVVARPVDGSTPSRSRVPFSIGSG